MKIKMLTAVVVSLLAVSGAAFAGENVSVQPKIEFVPVTWTSKNPEDKVVVIGSSTYRSVMISVNSYYGTMPATGINVTNCTNFKKLAINTIAVCTIDNVNEPVVITSDSVVGSQGIVQIQ